MAKNGKGKYRFWKLLKKNPSSSMRKKLAFRNEVSNTLMKLTDGYLSSFMTHNQYCEDSIELKAMMVISF